MVSMKRLSSMWERSMDHSVVASESMGYSVILCVLDHYSLWRDAQEGNGSLLISTLRGISTGNSRRSVSRVMNGWWIY